MPHTYKIVLASNSIKSPYTFPLHTRTRCPSRSQSFIDLVHTLYTLNQGDYIEFYPGWDSPKLKLAALVGLYDQARSIAWFANLSCKKKNIPFKLVCEKIGELSNPNYHIKITRIN